MAKTQGELDNTFWNLQRGSPAKFINVSQNQTMGFIRRRATRSTKNRLRQQSPLSLSSTIWKDLTQTQKDDWTFVAADYGLNGWQLFVQRGTEQQLRGPTELGAYTFGNAFYGFGSDLENNEPGTLANYKAGKVSIITNPVGILIEQAHPASYNVRRRIPQSQQVFETVAVNEELILPLTIGVSYRTMLNEAGENPDAKFYARIEYETESGTAYDEQGFTLELGDGWTRDSLIITEAPGAVLGYSLFFSFTDLDGEFWFDNVEAVHTGTNWAIDPFCNNVAPEILPQWGNVNPTWQKNVTDEFALLETALIDELSLE